MFVADGNFKADHLTPKNEEDDVHLTEGEAYVMADGPYKVHLDDATSKATRKTRVSFSFNPVHKHQADVYDGNPYC